MKTSKPLCKTSLFAINKRLQQLNRMKTLGAIVLLISVGGAITVLMRHPNVPAKHRAISQADSIHFVGPISQEYGHKEMQSAIFEQQMRGDETAKHARQLSRQLHDQQTQIAQLNNQVSALQKKVIHLKLTPTLSTTALSKSVPPHAPLRTIKLVPPPPQSTSINRSHQRSSVLTRPLSPHYTPLALPTILPSKQPVQASQFIVPSGTFVKAILLSGADANASVNGEKNTDPMLLRILDNGTLPNGHHSSLKGCFVTGSIYGDISSERGQIRTELLSCIRHDGEVLNIPVQGTVVGSAGKNGLRGVPVMRNGKILWNAGLSGGIAGLGAAAQKSQENQSSSPLGSVSTVSGNYLSYAAYGGMKSAADQLARYYVQRAEQYHPVIQINPGSLVTIIFLKPFSLSTRQPVVGLSPQQKKTVTQSTSTIRTTLTSQQQAAYQQYRQRAATAYPTLNLPGMPPAFTTTGEVQ